MRTVVVDELATNLLLGLDFMISTNLVLEPNTRLVKCGKPTKLEQPELSPSIPRESDESLAHLVCSIHEGPRPTDPEEEPIHPFLDDRDEDERESPYVFTGETSKANLSMGEINIGKHLSREEEDELTNRLEGFREFFSFNGELGDCTVIEHEIDTEDHKPVHSAPYRQSNAICERVQQQVGEWLRDGVIRPSKSPWSLPVVVVPKKDQSLRMCIDLRRVNQITKRDVYPLPNLEDLLTSLNGSTYFSSLDLNQGYMQIRMEQSSIPKTAFITQEGLYEFVRMPFGLTNAPATFQRGMDIVLGGGLKWNSCLVHHDDVIIFGRDFEDHNRKMEAVLTRIRSAQLTIKPTKCAFGVTELRFLGHVVSKEGVRMDPLKVKSILEQPTPTDVGGIGSFIGLATYYRRFVKDFSKVAEPMIKLLKKNAQFEWGTEQQRAFEELKNRLSTQPKLCHYDPNLPLELRTDASGVGLGAILLHVFPEKEKRVIAYASRKLQAAEKNYGVTELECLAVVWAIDKFRIYLQGVQFKVVTDHLALQWLRTKKDLTARLMRWALKLEPYDYEVVYKSGVQNRDADFLSRYPVNRIAAGHRGTYRRKQHPLERADLEFEPGPRLTEQTIRNAQAEDPECQEIRRHLHERSQFSEIQGILLENIPYEGRRIGPRIVLPRALINDVLYALHDDPMSGHCGPRKIIWKFHQRYYLPRANRLIKRYVQSCHCCQRKKDRWTRRFGMLKPIEPGLRPFERIGIDILGPLRRSKGGNLRIVVVTDYMTRWAITRAIPRETAQAIASMLIEDIYLQFGAPETILSDRGTSFRSLLLAEIFKEFEVRHITSTPYHPQTNGLVMIRCTKVCVCVYMFFIVRFPKQD